MFKAILLFSSSMYALLNEKLDTENSKFSSLEKD